MSNCNETRADSKFDIKFQKNNTDFVDLVLHSVRKVLNSQLNGITKGTRGG